MLLQFRYETPYNATWGRNDVIYTMEKLQTLNKDEIRVILVDILRREEELRLSSICQESFGLIGEAHEEFNAFVTALQGHASMEFRMDPAVGVELIRSAVSLYPEDKAISSGQYSHYVRHNRCRMGELRVGDTPPDVSLVTQKACC